MPRQTTPIWNATKINNGAELTIYAPIEDEESWWYDSVSPKGVMRALKNMGNVDEILVRINSPGGSVFAGLAIYQYLKDHKAKVTVKVDGLAASAASVIMMAGDTIIMGTGAMVMAHNPWAGPMYGEAKDFRAAADMLDKTQTSLVSVYQDRTGKNEDDLKTMLNASTWMTADEAVSLGFADEVDRKTKVAATIKNGIASFGGQRFDLRAFASIPPLPEALEEDEAEEVAAEDSAEEQPAPESAEGDDEIMDLAELKAKHPDILKAAVQEERERIKALDEMATPANAALIASAKESGKSPEATAMEIIKADNERRKAMAGKLKNDADNSGVNDVETDAPETGTDSKETKEQKDVEAKASGIAARAAALRGGKR
ncbi:head maturation protease, ClpP-related [Cohnella sp. GCM10012308]|uniref:head maturation protease, ClpP-related n=1 Tax=Cohnella sp. GCM10012308 TaxID=3317329 RepID=UPI00361EAD76